MADIARALVSLPFSPGDEVWFDNGNSMAHLGTVLCIDPPCAKLRRHRDGAQVVAPISALDHRITSAAARWTDATAVYRAKGFSARAVEMHAAVHESRLIQDKIDEIEANDRLRATRIADKVAREVAGFGDAIQAAYLDERLIPRVGRALAKMQMDPSYGAAMDTLVTDVISKYIFEEWFRQRTQTTVVSSDEAVRARETVATAAALWCEERGSMRMIGGEVLARAVDGSDIATDG
tara:strand:- start:853 stop:1560 length:708 start_codon:yes stop_codon:yes gene_type:complete